MKKKKHLSFNDCIILLKKKVFDFIRLHISFVNVLLNLQDSHSVVDPNLIIWRLGSKLKKIKLGGQNYKKLGVIFKFFFFRIFSKVLFFEKKNLGAWGQAPSPLEH
jgi:hypothetical protein